MLQQNMDFQKDGYHGEVIGEATPDILVSRFVSPLKPIFILVYSLILINYHRFTFGFFCFRVSYISSPYVCYWGYLFSIANN